jgi:hypothetical protein
MGELEPTITEHEPTATERLRALLDERGVEWDADDEAMDDGSLSQVTYWYCNGIEWSADGRDEYLAFDAVQLLTPEQAIAATLGREDTYTREDVESAFVSGYSLGSLPVGSDPRWDENVQTVDEHMAELGWMRISDTEDASTDTNGYDSGHVRNMSATLGTGTCHADETYSYECIGDDSSCYGKVITVHVMECSECGGTYEHVNGSYEYCPRCGRRIEVVDE